MTLIPARKSLTPTGDPNTYYNKGETDALLSGKASTDLTNLSSTGQMIIDSQNGTISNCVLEIPQNLKLTLENNVLTLKAGSILTNTGSTYQTVTTTQDIVRNYGVSIPDGTYIIFNAFASTYGLSQLKDITKINSGSSLPADGSTYNTFFNTTDQKIYAYGGSTWSVWLVAYPLCVLKCENNVLSFAKDRKGNDMIFNGAGFIGHHAFIYPGVKGYSPEGWTGVHHLNSNVYVNSSLKIIELDQGQGVTGYNRILGFNNLDSQQKARFYNEYNTRADAPLNISWRFCYIRDENQILFSSNGTNIIKWHDSPFIEYNVNTDNVVTDFTIRQPVRTATVEMLNKKQDVLTFDSTPTANSTNPVTSGGVYNALSDKQADITLITGYDATKTQTLKNVSGVLTWIDDE